MATSWFAVWVPLAGFAHAFALFVLLWNSRLVRHSRAWRLLAKAFSRVCQQSAGAAGIGSPKLGSLPPSSVSQSSSFKHAVRRLQNAHGTRAILSWRHLGCSYPAPGQKGGRKAVLQDAMGVVSEGQLAAILGPSGGGKSTLLEMLAGRKALGELYGRLGLASRWMPPATRATPALPIPGAPPTPLTCAPPTAVTTIVQPTTLAEPPPNSQQQTRTATASDFSLSHRLPPAGPPPTLALAVAEVASPADEMGHATTMDSPTGIKGGHARISGDNSSTGSGVCGCGREVDGTWLVWRDVRQHAEAVKNVAAFVPQESVFPASLTAEEVLMVQASLMGIGEATYQQRRVTVADQVSAASITTQATAGPSTHRQRLQSAVAHALREIGLAQQASTLVGGPLAGGLVLRGLSGGERKRLSVAAGLIGGPTLLLLDEPTTGQDASAAAALMGHLSALCARQGLTVLCSLHQPRASIWECLDVVVVLSQGYTIYSGPRLGLVPALEPLGYAYAPAKHGSPANWVMDLVNTSFDKPAELFGHTMTTCEELSKAAAAAAAGWTSTHPLLEGEVTAAAAEAEANRPGRLSACGALGACLPGAQWRLKDEEVAVKGPGKGTGTVAATGGSEAASAASAPGVLERERERARRGASWWRQFMVLSWREATIVIRNPMDLAGRMLAFCWAAIVIGAVFYGLPDTIQGLMSRSIVSYVESIVLFLLPFVYMSYYAADRQIFVADIVAGLYSPSAYYVAKAGQLTLFSALNSVVFTGIIYAMANLQPRGVSLLHNIVLGSLGYLTAQQVMYCASIIAPNQDVAFMHGILWTAINILVSNYPILLSDYTMSWVWPVRYASALYYTFSGMLASQFRDAPLLSCAEGLGPSTVKYLPEFLPRTSPEQMSYVQSRLSSPGAECQLNLRTVVDYFDIQWEWWVYALLVLGYLLVVHILTFIALLWTTRKEMR